MDGELEVEDEDYEDFIDKPQSKITRFALYIFGLSQVLKYMIPGIAAAIIAGVYFASQQAEFVTIILFCGLITYAIVTSHHIALLKKENEKLTERLDDNTELLSARIGMLAQATDEELQSLSGKVGEDMYELTQLIADKIHGPRDDDGGDFLG